MGVVLPYYHPARVVEIGMLDHLTGGRLEIGTAIGVPQELSRLNMTMAEARERNDEIVAFLDAALTNRIVSYRGKYFLFSNVRLLPRPLQQPRAVGAGHFLTVLNWSAPVDEVARAHDLFGREAIPLLRKA